MEQTAQIALSIDGRPVEVPEGTTILEAARQQGIAIPTLCHHPALSPWGGCRLCLVEVDSGPRLVASCVMPVRKGMEVVTNNPRIHEARRTILEFLFSERRHYCMYCAQSGDCELQALAYAHGLDHFSLPHLAQEFPVDMSHPDLGLDHNRCVLCGRCVRACRDLAGVRTLDFSHRGGQAMMGADLAGPLGGSSCVSCGACLELCPTGAIFHRARTHQAILGKSQDWRQVEAPCPRCGALCPTSARVRGNQLLELEAGQAGQTWQAALCRKGRLEPFQEASPRLLSPMWREAEGSWRALSWEEALNLAAQGLRRAMGQNGADSLRGLVSSSCSCEEISAFQELMQHRLSGAQADTLDGRHYRAWSQAGLAKRPQPPWTVLLQADLIILAGARPWEGHPLVEALVRRAILQNQARLAVLGQDDRLGPLAAYYLPAPDQDLPDLIQDLAGSGGQTAALAQDLARAARPVLVTGPPLTGLGLPTPLGSLAGLAGAKGQLIVLKPGGNSAGAWAMGAPAAKEPAPGVKLAAGLICLEQESEAREELLPGLNGNGFVVALCPWQSPQLLAQARVLLPKPTWLEAAGTYALAWGGGHQLKPALLQSPDQVPPGAVTLTRLAERL